MSYLLAAIIFTVIASQGSSQQRACSLLNLQSHELRIYSQNGEDGVLLRILEIVGISNYFYVEFGVGGGNSRVLRDKIAFKGLIIDRNNENVDINLRKENVTIDNVINILQKYEISTDFCVLFVNSEMFSWWILQTVLSKGIYRPRVMVVEVNPALGLQDREEEDSDVLNRFAELNALPLVVAHPHVLKKNEWNDTRYFGANPKAFHKLGEIFGYKIVHCESRGLRCFLVANEVLPQDCSKGELFRDISAIHYLAHKDLSINQYYKPRDPAGRMPVLLSESLAKSLISGPVSLDRIANHLISTSPSMPDWGRDWGSFIFEYSMYLSDFDNDVFMMHFIRGEVQYLRQQKYLEGSLSFAKAASVATKGCKSNSWPELACRASAVANHNAAVCLLNVPFDVDSELGLAGANYSPVNNSLIAEYLSKASNTISNGIGNLRIPQFSLFLNSIIKSVEFIKNTANIETKNQILPDGTLLSENGELNMCTNSALIQQVLCTKYITNLQLCDDQTVLPLQTKEFIKSVIKFPSWYFTRQNATTRDESFVVSAPKDSFDSGRLAALINEFTDILLKFCGSK